MCYKSKRQRERERERESESEKEVTSTNYFVNNEIKTQKFPLKTNDSNSNNTIANEQTIEI